MTPEQSIALTLRSLVCGLLVGAVFDDPIDRPVLWTALAVLVLAEIVGTWEQHGNKLSHGVSALVHLGHKVSRLVTRRPR